MSRPFWQATSVRNFRTSTLERLCQIKREINVLNYVYLKSNSSTEHYMLLIVQLASQKPYQEMSTWIEPGHTSIYQAKIMTEVKKVCKTKA